MRRKKKPNISGRLFYCIKFVLIKISPLLMQQEMGHALRLTRTHLPERINDLYLRFIAGLNEIFFLLYVYIRDPLVHCMSASMYASAPWDLTVFSLDGTNKCPYSQHTYIIIITICRWPGAMAASGCAFICVCIPTCMRFLVSTRGIMRQWSAATFWGTHHHHPHRNYPTSPICTHLISTKSLSIVPLLSLSYL